VVVDFPVEHAVIAAIVRHERLVSCRPRILDRQPRITEGELPYPRDYRVVGPTMPLCIINQADTVRNSVCSRIDSSGDAAHC